MVNMGMRENDAIEFGGIEAQIAVRCIGLHSFSLVHTTIEEDRMSGIGSNQMFATRYFAGGSEKLYFHGIRQIKSNHSHSA